MNIQAMMQQARKMQADMEKKQAELATQSFEAASGGGMVTVKVSGQMQLQTVIIDPTIAKPEDVDLLQDLVLTATNEALGKAQAAAQGLMSGMMPSALKGMF